MYNEGCGFVQRGVLKLLGLEFRIYAVGLVERAEPPEGGTPNGGGVMVSSARERISVEFHGHILRRQSLRAD